MYTPRSKILWFALATRLTIFLLQFIFNSLCPDHNADAFRSPIGSEKISVWDDIVNYLFGGLTRWDGEYFVHIAKYGYTYESTLAFYPLYPMTIRVFAVVLSKVFFMLNIHSTVVIAGVLINFLCFLKSAIVFYDLSKRVLKEESTAYKAAVLYCVNPASIFFSAIYSESVFAYLTFYSMLASLENNFYSCFPIGLSTVARSNGVVNMGFPVYFNVRSMYHIVASKLNFTRDSVFKRVWDLLWGTAILKNCFLLCSNIAVSIIPLVLLQIYNYSIFCIFNSSKDIPAHVVRHGVKNNLVLPSTGNVTWCQNSVPMAYSDIQRKYWNVGFMNYYEFKQIPNFILASPILYILLRCAKEFFSEHKGELYTLGFAERKIKAKKEMNEKKYPLEMFVFVVHGLFLTLFCIFFIHIQVSTRLLSSASPLLYWYCALTLSYRPDSTDSTYEEKENLFSKWKVFFLTQRRFTLQDKLILSYFLGYFVVGSFMFSNFLPWT